jgi:hypothetical protein
MKSRAAAPAGNEHDANVGRVYLTDAELRFLPPRRAPRLCARSTGLKPIDLRADRAPAVRGLRRGQRGLAPSRRLRSLSG